MDLLQNMDDAIFDLIERYKLLDFTQTSLTDDQVRQAVSVATSIGRDAQNNNHTASSQETKPEARGSEAVPGRTPPPKVERWIPVAKKMELLASKDAESQNEDATPDDEQGENCRESKGHDCVVCISAGKADIRMDCDHWWCSACAREAIRIGLSRADAWPPKCCTPFPEEVLERVRQPGWVQIWRQIKQEQETPGDERVYCSRPECAEFIPGRAEMKEVRVGATAQCQVCETLTCLACRERGHPGRPCSLEEEDEMLMDMMDRDNLASCPKCQRIVQLVQGCNHIRCHCGENWCFMCGEQWTVHGHDCPESGVSGQRRGARQRKHRFRQGRGPEDHIPQQPEGFNMPGNAARPFHPGDNVRRPAGGNFIAGPPDWQPRQYMMYTTIPIRPQQHPVQRHQFMPHQPPGMNSLQHYPPHQPIPYYMGVAHQPPPNRSLHTPLHEFIPPSHPGRSQQPPYYGGIAGNPAYDWHQPPPPPTTAGHGARRFHRERRGRS